MSYHVGLDFGTSQTKCCVYEAKAGAGLHRFFEFPNGTFFLPSVVSDTGSRFRYGQYIDGKPNYSYFKMAAAQDEEFQDELSQP